MASNAIFDFCLPDATELSGLDSALKKRLDQNLKSASKRVAAFTEKMARGNQVPTKGDHKLIDARMMLEAVADDLSREMIKLGKRSRNLTKKDDLEKFENTRENVIKLWNEYSAAADLVISRTAKAKRSSHRQ